MDWPVDPHRYLTFLGVMALLAMTPGPANLFAVATGVRDGKAAALLGMMGMNAATLVWFGAAALGLGTLVTAFPAIFRFIAIAGGLYVAWLGIQAICGTGHAPGDPGKAHLTRRGPLIDGFMVQFANPKAVLFFTAVLPPFLDPARPLAPQLALFAVATIGLDAITMSAYGLSGAALTRRMTDPAFARAFGWISGGLLLIAAAMIIFRH
ncbi:MAG TPA: LysE family translocator [Brevundimonas sp.]|jgi:threonine/homoserine/homoserine lactone efflux protein|uniref:LysE family translocator n=1 Tax=Brevundimonas sp. TaxID=1871086 RepID=UPI002BF72653|nr:LysE family translocator [Brevundimonas sp.]HRH20197.1 LysE family translocator [Brevundimonas sp.]